MLIVVIRALLLYMLMIFSLRLMGKRQLGELQPSELCITILISNIASIPIEDPTIPMTWGAIPILVLVGFELIVSYVALEKRTLRKLMSGSPVVIISDGTIHQGALKSLRFSIDDLMESLREQNVFDIRDVDYAVVETSGSVSVLQKYQAQSITPSMLGLPTGNSSPAIVLINNGAVVPETFCCCNLTSQWLAQTLEKEQIQCNDIFLMTVNKQHEYHIVPKQL